MTRGFAIRTTGRTTPSDAARREAATLRGKALELRRQAEHYLNEARRCTVSAEQIDRRASELDGGGR